jgi:hypothetical protein
LATSATGERSASRRIATICSSVNRLFLIGSSFSAKSHLSRNQLIEKGRQVTGGPPFIGISSQAHLASPPPFKLTA